MGLFKQLTFILITLYIFKCDDIIPQCNFTIDLSNYTEYTQQSLKYSPYIHSPKHLQVYPMDIKNCWYQIKFSKNYGLKLLFDEFDLQNAECGLNKTECCDYLDIGYGSIVGENSIKRLCGRDQYFEPMYFEYNEIWLNFNSDDSNSFKGFSAILTPFQLTYDNLKGKIKCPNYDETTSIYPNNVNITYTIDLPDKYIIVLYFDSIDLEKFNDTCYDYIEIIEPSIENSVQINDDKFKKRSKTVICGNDEPNEYKSLSNKLKLRFYSDESETGELFDIKYKTIQKIFTEPDYTIFSPMYPGSGQYNITYTIKAPKDFKIEIRIVDFEFTRCMANDLDELAQQPDKVCYEKNDYLMITNGRGDLDENLFNQINNMKNNNTSLILCDCNRPIKKYMSIGNELNIELFTRTNNDFTRNQFRIAYKFVPNLIKLSKTVQVIQDSALNYVNGYLLRVQVPIGHNVRLYGKSLRCLLPDKTILLVEKDSTYNLRYLTNTTDPLTKKPYCNYSFDLNEPEIKTVNNDDWFISWYFPFKYSLEGINFDINIIFIKNEISNKENGVYTFPPQFGYNISDESSFKLEMQLSRKYLIQFSSEINDANRNISELSNFINNIDSYVKVKKSNKDNDDIIHVGYLANSEIIYPIDASQGIIKIKRNNLWSVNVTYKLDKYFGDCNFDESICDYKKDNDDDYYNLEHNVKNEWKSSIDEPTDFYLSITKPIGSDVKRAVVYTPSIVERNITELKEMNKEIYNKKIYSLSFSFKPGKPTDRVEVFLQTNRSEMYLTKDTDEIQLIKKFSINDGVKIVQKSSSSSCSSYSMASQITEDNSWYRMKNILIYSCYDFRLGFAALYGQNNDFIETKSTISIDDVNIDFKENVENCKENICGPHGSCVNFFNTPICCCDAGFEGTKCEEKINICPEIESIEENDINSMMDFSNQLCENNSTCIDLDEEYDYICKCKPGFTGKNCETEIDECESNPCLNGGKCFDKIGYYKCGCKIGFSGQNCEIIEPGCEKCMNSTCIHIGQNKIKCLCPRGRTGDDCSIDVDECLSNPCNPENNATCVNLDNAFKCLCPPGYTGKVCEVPIDYCKDYPNDVCKNGGFCVNENGNMTCRCHFGYTGLYCEIEINECLEQDDPCNGGICLDKYLDFECVCPRGRTGRYCDTILENPCEGHKCKFGKCVPTFNNSYECNCNPFYQGDYCEELKKCNIEEYAKECNPSGTIKAVGYGPTCLCKCKVGFYGDKCEFKEDLCKLKRIECLNGGTCIDIDDDAKCSCRHGFSGEICEIAENACKDKPCLHGRCKNYGSYYVCNCDRGWTGENCNILEKICNITVDCKIENTEEVFNYDTTKCVCKCKPGYTGDRCETNIDDCVFSKVNCNNGKCIDYLQTYHCECDEGYTGTFCDKKITGCAANPCKFGACINSPNGYMCECLKGYTGLLCDTKIDNCDPNPCRNGGTCHDYIDGYVCECPIEYGKSKNCHEMKRNPCLREPCFNNATCVPVVAASKTDKNSMIYTGFNCQCKDEYIGNKCETLKTPCVSSPCQNFGTCINSRDNRDYHCKCFPLFTGKNCESYYDACAKNPCLNNGTCYQTPFGFKCQCTYEHEGTRCEKKANLCAKFSCLNGGTCQIEDNIPYCRCPTSRFIGTRCEIDLELRINITAEAEMLGVSESEKNCGLLGNNATFLTYILAAFIIFLIFLFIILSIYLYVHCSIKNIQRYKEQVSFEKSVLKDLSYLPKRIQN